MLAKKPTPDPRLLAAALIEEEEFLERCAEIEADWFLKKEAFKLNWMWVRRALDSGVLTLEPICLAFNLALEEICLDLKRDSKEEPTLRQLIEQVRLLMSEETVEVADYYDPKQRRTIHVPDLPYRAEDGWDPLGLWPKFRAVMWYGIEAKGRLYIVAHNNPTAVVH